VDRFAGNRIIPFEYLNTPGPTNAVRRRGSRLRVLGGWRDEAMLKPDGIVVMTIDLFLDLKPFSDREANVWGRNLDINRFLNMAGLRLEQGDPAELLGFPEFEPSKIMGNLASYLVGEGYPALSQCIIARHDHHY
jgi:hypothetical protein